MVQTSEIMRTVRFGCKILDEIGLRYTFRFTRFLNFFWV